VSTLAIPHVTKDQTAKSQWGYEGESNSTQMLSSSWRFLTFS